MLLTTRLADLFGMGTNRKHKRKHKKALRGVEALESRQLLTAEFFVANGGDDWAAGSLDQPFQTIRRALDAAQPGDTITLRNGLYEGGVTIDIDQLTIRSMPGEWAVIESPLAKITDGHANSVLRYSWDVQGGRLENLEIVGGHYYGVMFWDWWDSDFAPGSIHVGASGITLDGVKVHDTGVDGIKITPGANDITILNSEVYNTGRRTTSSADGIDNNNGDRMIVRNTYVHDVPGIGILTSGGTDGSLIEQNLIKNVAGAGIVNGFYTELEWLEPDTNPGHFASLDTIVRNNIVVEAGQAGIGIYGALNPQVYNNTLVNPAQQAQAPIQFGGYDMWVSNTAPSYQHIASVNPQVFNNIVVTEADNLTRMVDIRENSIVGPLTLDYNLYFGTSTRGVLFIDRNLTGDGTPEQTFSQWQENYGYDTHSLLVDPQLDTSWHLVAGSPGIGQALAWAGLTIDIDGNLRVDGAPDVGADEFAAGSTLPLPPAPFGAPSLELDDWRYHDAESQTVQVRVLRHGSVADTVTVHYATIPGTAQAGIDFTPVDGTLVFAPGETEKIVSIPLLTDTFSEGDEHFLIALSSPTTDGSYPVRLGHQHTASITIDDEQTPITLHYATKFVSPTGNDANGDGSAANPWKSLQHAADQVGPGDYVIVQPGKYWGMTLTNDGKADARITFHAMPGVEIDEAYPGQLDGINLEGADYVTIEGFHVHDMPRAGIRSVNNDGVILRDNVSENNTWWGFLTGWSENVVIENNVASGSEREHGIYISNSADGAIVRNNVVFGNNDSGIQFNADAYLPGDGIHSNNIIEGNIIYENGLGGGAALNFDGVQDSVIQNNLLYNNHATGIVLYVGFAADGSRNNLVANNTVVMAEDARWALMMTDGSDGNTLISNILLNKNPNRGSITVESNSLPARSDYNIVQDLFQLNGYNSDFAAWQAFSGGADAHSIVMDHSNVATELANLFVDPAANDYHLKPDSVAIDAGDLTDAPATDLFGHARPFGLGVDIGAYEAGEFNPSLHFEWANVIGYESIGMAEVALVRTGNTEGTLYVDVQSAPGSASATDFVPVFEQIVFEPGETRKTFRFFVNDDLDIEAPETVELSYTVVGDPTGLVGDPTGLATLHIVSDDAWQPGTFAFDTNSVTVDEAAGAVNITVHRQGGSNGAAEVNFATGSFTPPKAVTWIEKHTDLLYPTDTDLPATADADYAASQGTLYFADGETSKSITIPITNDAYYEGGEAFLLKLLNPSNGAALGTKQQIKVRVESDDAKLPGTFQFSSPTYVVTEGAPELSVTVFRDVGNVEAAVNLYHTGAGDGSTTASAWSPTDYSGVPMSLTFAAGELSKTISIPIVDDTSSEIVEQFSIQLFSPTNDAVLGGVSKTIVSIHDNDSTFYFQLPAGANSFSATEGSGQFPVTVVRQGALGTDASVQVSTNAWGSATAGADFVPTTVTLAFAAGEASQTIWIPIVNDSLMEPNETFAVSMSNAVGAMQGSWSQTASIVDDDQAASPGQFQFASAGFSVNEAAGTVEIVVHRAGGSDGTVSVEYRTYDGATGFSWDQTAYSGSDYTSKSGLLVFAPGETTKVFSVPILNDTRVEKNEVFTVELRMPSGGATLGSVSRAVVTIVEDDSAIQFGTSNYVVNEAAGYVTITLVRTGSSVGAASVDLNISSGSASNGTDFIKPMSPTVTFADGESVKTIQLQMLDDSFKESDEWLYLSLSNATNAKLGSSLWGNVKITDND